MNVTHGIDQRVAADTKGGRPSHQLALSSGEATSRWPWATSHEITSPASSSGPCSAALSTMSAVLGDFVVRIDAGEIPDLAGAGLPIEPLGIALLADLERRVDEDLDEFLLVHEFPCHPALRPER